MPDSGTKPIHVETKQLVTGPDGKQRIVIVCKQCEAEYETRLALNKKAPDEERNT